MIKDQTRKEVRALMKECATEGTFWNRHLEADDVIDLWRETNRILARNGEGVVSFDVFYVALERFKKDYTDNFEGAVNEFLKMVEEKPEVTVQWKPEARPRTEGSRRNARVKRTGAGSIQVTGTFNPEGQHPIEMTVEYAADDRSRLIDYFNMNHDRFICDLFFGFLSQRR